MVAGGQNSAFFVSSEVKKGKEDTKLHIEVIQCALVCGSKELNPTNMTIEIRAQADPSTRVVISIPEVVMSFKNKTAVDNLPIYNKHLMPALHNLIAGVWSNNTSELCTVIRRFFTNYSALKTDKEREEFVEDEDNYKLTESSDSSFKSKVVDFVRKIVAILVAHNIIYETLDYNSASVAAVDASIWAWMLTAVSNFINRIQADSWEDLQKREYTFYPSVDKRREVLLKAVSALPQASTDNNTTNNNNYSNKPNQKHKHHQPQRTQRTGEDAADVNIPAPPQPQPTNQTILYQGDAAHVRAMQIALQKARSKKVCEACVFHKRGGIYTHTTDECGIFHNTVANGAIFPKK